MALPDTPDACSTRLLDGDREHIEQQKVDLRSPSAQFQRQGEGSWVSQSQAVQLSRRLYRGAGPWDAYPLLHPRPSLRQQLARACRCTRQKAGRVALGLVPVIDVLRTYKLREYAMGDFLAGLSSAFLHLPQGLGFGILAALQPVYGLNTTFFSILLYMIFGTSPHVSMGTNAVIALLTADVVLKQSGSLSGNPSLLANVTANDTLTDSEMEFRIGVAMAATMLSGVILLVMGFLRLGFLTNYMAVSFVGAFTTAAAIHIASSQVPKMLNIKIPPFSGFGKLIRTYVAIFSSLGRANPADVVIAVISVAILLAVKVGVNDRCKHRMKIPVPIDLLLVISFTVASHFGQFKERWGVSVVGAVPSGLPSPRLPDVSVMPDIITQSFVIAILTFTLTTALASVCARVHGFQVDSNRELIAYGMTNLASSFFRCFPSCTAPPRTMILSSLGARTTLNGLPAFVFMLVVLLAAGPLFEELPMAMLGAMIAVAMKDLLLQFRQLPGYWRVSKSDFAIWLVTWLVATLGDLDFGLLAGVVFSMLTVLIAGQVTDGQLLGVSEREDLCLPVERKGMRPPASAAIFRFPAQLYFATADRFRSQLYSRVLNPTKVRIEVVGKDGPAENSDHRTDASTGNEAEADVRHLILDCSAMTYVDATGLAALRQVVSQYSDVEVQVLLASCPAFLSRALKNSGFFDTFSEDQTFLDVWDALRWLEQQSTDQAPMDNTTHL